MAIAFTCECGKGFKLKDEYAGRRAICPACQRELIVPQAKLPRDEDFVELHELGPVWTSGKAIASLMLGLCSVLAVSFFDSDGVLPTLGFFTFFLTGTTAIVFGIMAWLDDPAKRVSGKAIASFMLGLCSVLTGVLAFSFLDSDGGPNRPGIVTSLSTGITAIAFGIMAWHDSDGPAKRVSGKAMAGAGIVLGSVLSMPFIIIVSIGGIVRIVFPDPHLTEPEVLSDVIQAERVQKPGRNPKIPIEVSYPVMDEYRDPPRCRSVSIALNMKVSEEVLREIALEIKGKEIEQYQTTHAYFYLPEYWDGKLQWAYAGFNPTLDVGIVGLREGEDRVLAGLRVTLPPNSTLIGSWISQEHPYRMTIYEADGNYYMMTHYPNDKWENPVVAQLHTHDLKKIPSTGEPVFETKYGTAYRITAWGGLEELDRYVHRGEVPRSIAQPVK